MSRDGVLAGILGMISFVGFIDSVASHDRITTIIFGAIGGIMLFCAMQDFLEGE
jgi:hypothetical protein